MNGYKHKLLGKTEAFHSRQFGDYLGIHVSSSILISYLSALRERLGEKAFKLYTDNRKNRDGDEHHITIITPIEWDKVDQDLSSLANQELAFQLIGLGTISKDDDSTYYIVVESDHAQVLRADVGLEQKDLHITLGFDAQDVHDVQKNHSTLVSY